MAAVADYIRVYKYNMQDKTVHSDTEKRDETTEANGEDTKDIKHCQDRRQWLWGIAGPCWHWGGDEIQLLAHNWK